jgi:hypothetical protein
MMKSYLVPIGTITAYVLALNLYLFPQLWLLLSLLFSHHNCSHCLARHVGAKHVQKKVFDMSHVTSSLPFNYDVRIP